MLPRTSRSLRISHVGSNPAGFTLIELLTVILIIGILIGILVPALGGARSAAKNASTAAMISAVQAALEAFKDENGKEFIRSGGYPCSYMHPNILDGDNQPIFTMEHGASGRFPFIEIFPQVYGAHFLPAMLMGVDGHGFVPRSGIPKDLLGEPHKWYAPIDDQGTLLPRAARYLDPDRVRLLRTEELPGNRNPLLFPQWNVMKHLPVIVDSFDRPLLYYVPNHHGSLSNMMEAYYSPQNQYPDGPPLYYQVDNMGFTGTRGDRPPSYDGWDFGAGPVHRITRSGEKLTALDIDKSENRDTLARYILDMKAFRAIRNPSAKSPLRPVNKDSYLLITAGRDALYGTSDDVKNFGSEE